MELARRACLAARRAIAKEADSAEARGYVCAAVGRVGIVDTRLAARRAVAKEAGPAEARGYVCAAEGRVGVVNAACPAA